MQKKRILTLVAWAAAVVIFLIVGKMTGILRPFEWVSETIITPAQGSLYHIGITWFGGKEQHTLDELQKEKEDLKTQINNLLVENTRLHTALSAVDDLQKQLEKISGSGATGITAKAIGHGLDSDGNSLQINAGQDDGVVEGSAVLVDDGVLIGRISRVDAATSIVTLLTSPSIAMAAQIQNETLSPGVVSGEHGLALRMSLIPQTDVVSPNTVVVTSGTDPLIPEQLIIGTISTITSTPGGLFQEATITPLFDPVNIRFVTVVVK